jgi:hypothetical protein
MFERSAVHRVLFHCKSRHATRPSVENTDLGAGYVYLQIKTAFYMISVTENLNYRTWRKISWLNFGVALVTERDSSPYNAAWMNVHFQKTADSNLEKLSSVLTTVFPVLLFLSGKFRRRQLDWSKKTINSIHSFLIGYSIIILPFVAPSRDKTL